MIKKIIFLLLMVGMVFTLYKVATFSLFDSTSTVIEKIQVRGKNYSLKIYYSPSDATTQSAIVVMKGDLDGEESSLAVYERCDSMLHYNFIDDNEIEFILRNSMGNIDTVKLELP
jgi:anionic cell wall polymer biosynthesis LytR-Cps2A-Psr (LCP) family protein